MSKISYIKQLDGLRCFAVLGVMIFHLIGPTSFFLNKIPFGYGVDLFFVLSGFLISKILFTVKDKGTNNYLLDFRNFFIRRALKIFPIYYITITFLYFIQFQNFSEVHNWVTTYTTNIWICLGRPYLGSYNHLWSLAVEEQFYLFWPFLIFIIDRNNLKKLIILTIGASILFKISLYCYNGSWTPAINAFTLSCMDTLGLGSLLAYCLHYERQLYEKYFLNKFLFALIFLIYFFTMIVPLFPDQIWIQGIFANLLFSFVAVIIVAPSVTDSYKGVIKWILENPLVIHIGKISYGLYLYHLFMPDLYNYLLSLGYFTGNTDNFRYAFYFVACFVIAEFSWFVVERPILKLKSKFN